MNLLITCALPVELNTCKEAFKKVISQGLNIHFLLTGSGNYSTMYELQNFLAGTQIDFIVNIGVCGTSENIENILPIIQVYRIKNLASMRESIIPIYFEFAQLTSLANSERIVTSPDEMMGENCVDMESYAIDFIATKKRIPYIIIKLPFDRVGAKSREVNISQIPNLFQAVDYQKLLASIEKYLQKNKHEEEIFLDIYFDFLRATFSEKEIIKRQYMRFLALGLDFTDFFETHKTLPKKQFFQELQAYC